MPGSLLALAWTGPAVLAAALLFRRSWQLGILLPAGALFFLLLAWLIHLREDGFAKPPLVSPAPDADPRLPAETAHFVRPEAGIIPRAPARAEGRPDRGPWRALPALLWAASELILLSALLYRFAGVGRSW